MYEKDSAIAVFLSASTRYLALLFAFLLPILLIPASWSVGEQAKAIFACGVVVVVLIAWLIENVARRRVIFSLDPILLSALVLPIVYALSAVAVQGPLSSYVTGDAIPGTVAGMLILFGAALVAAIAVEDRKTSFKLMIALLLSGAFVALFQIARLFFPEQLSLFGALAGNTSTLVGSWHDLGIFLGFTIILSFGLLDTSVGNNRIFAIALEVLAALCFALMLVVNFSDTWYVLSGAALLYAIARALRTYRRMPQLTAAVRSAILWLVFAGVAALAAYGGSFVFSHLPSQLQVTQTEVRPSWQGTFAAGQRLFEGGKALVFGSGPNTFERQWALFKPSEVNATDFWNTDFQYGYGVVPTALITVGIIGTFGWVLLALALMWAGYRALIDESEGKLRVILFVGAAYLLCFHIIYVPGIGISLIMFLCLGILAGLNTSAWRAGVLTLAPQSILVFVVILVIACSAIAASLVQSRTIAANLITSRAAALYQKNGDLGAASKRVALALQIDPHSAASERAAVQIGLLQFQQLAQNAKTDDATRAELQKTLSATISHGLAAVSIDDTSYQNWLALAGLYQSLAGVGIQGAYEQAQTAWLRAASTTPKNPLPLVQLAQISMAQNKLPEALAYLGKAIELKPNLALAYYLRAQIEASQGTYKQAIEDAAAAAQLASQDPLGWYTLGTILYVSGDYQNAGAAFEKAVALQNDYSDALFALSVIYDKVGAHSNALTVIQKVLELNPNAEVAERVYQNLQANKPALDGLEGSAPSAQTTNGTTTKKP